MHMFGSRTSPRLLLALLPLLVLLTACETGPEPADLVLRGGKVVTVDDELPEARAVAVRGDRIVAVGGDADMDAYIGEATRVVELEGRLAVPGFIEGHGHFMSLGNAQMILDLNTARSWGEIVGLVEEAVESTPEGEWIAGRGWHQEKWDSVPEPTVDGVPVHDRLSAVSPDHPVVLTHASGHASFVNRAALDAAGIDASTPDPPGGTIVRDGRGRATGLLRETAQRLVGAARSEAESDRPEDAVREEARTRVRLAGEEALRNGVTSFQDAGADFETIDFFRELADRGELPVRLYVMVRRESNEAMDARLPEYRMSGYGNGFLTVRSIKRQIDGALGSHGALLIEPYEDLPGSRGLVLEPAEDIARTARIALRHGYQVNTHAIGDQANKDVLDIYQEAFAEAGADGDTLRWRIEHAQHLDPADVARFAELGVIAAMQGIHMCSDAPWVFARLGEERARSGAYVWRDLLDAGVVVTNGTDVPVEDIDPLASFHCSVTRLAHDGESFFPDQAMTRMEALRSYTIHNAYAAFEEDVKGSITPGKLADITVLSRDIMTVPAEEILETEVDLTILGGEVRYEREGGAG